MSPLLCFADAGDNLDDSSDQPFERGCVAGDADHAQLALVRDRVCRVEAERHL